MRRAGRPIDRSFSLDNVWAPFKAKPYAEWNLINMFVPWDVENEISTTHVLLRQRISTIRLGLVGVQQAKCVPVWSASSNGVPTPRCAIDVRIRQNDKSLGLVECLRLRKRTHQCSISGFEAMSKSLKNFLAVYEHFKYSTSSLYSLNLST